MSETIEQADELRRKALALLIAERNAIDERLKTLGYDGTTPISKPRVCGACGSEGHTTRTCASKKTGTEAPANQ